MTESEFNDQGDTFVEQAEYIDPAAFDTWAEEHPNEQQILQKLCQGGGKLITGPRGCGKTTWGFRISCGSFQESGIDPIHRSGSKSRSGNDLYCGIHKPVA